MSSINKDKESDQKGKVTSVYLGENKADFDRLQKFYPFITLPKILRKMSQELVESNRLLLDSKILVARNDQIMQMDQTILDKGINDIANIIENKKLLTDGLLFVKPPKIKSIKNIRDLDFSKQTVLVLLFAELLLEDSKAFRKEFISVVNKHQIPWRNILDLDEDDYDEDDFINDGSGYAYLNPLTIDSGLISEDFTVDNLFDDDEFEYPHFHDHDLFLKVLLLETLSLFKINKNNIYDFVCDILDNHEDNFKTKDAVLQIDLSGKIQRKGRSFRMPISVVPDADFNE